MISVTILLFPFLWWFIYEYMYLLELLFVSSCLKIWSLRCRGHVHCYRIISSLPINLPFCGLIFNQVVTCSSSICQMYDPYLNSKPRKKLQVYRITLYVKLTALKSKTIIFFKFYFVVLSKILPLMSNITKLKYQSKSLGYWSCVCNFTILPNNSWMTCFLRVTAFLNIFE